MDGDNGRSRPLHGRVDIPVGEFRWLTVVSPEEPDGAQLLLDPNVNPAAATYQRALFESGIPLTAFAVDDIEKEYQRLHRHGVAFTKVPTNEGGVIVAFLTTPAAISSKSTRNHETSQTSTHS